MKNKLISRDKLIGLFISLVIDPIFGKKVSSEQIFD